MEPSFYLQEPAAASGDADPSRANPSDVASSYLTPDGATGRQSSAPLTQIHEQFLHGGNSQAYPSSAQIAELHYAQGGSVAELFNEDPYASYAAPPIRTHQPGVHRQPLQAGRVPGPQELKQPEGPKADFEARAKGAEKKLKELEAQLGKALRDKATLEKDLVKERKDRTHFQELDSKRAQERESIAAWESHWRSQEKALKAAVEEGRRKNQAMQAKLGSLEARLQAACDEVEKLRGAAAAAGELAGRLEKELEEEKQAYRELEEDKAADRQLIAEGEAANVDWVQESVRLRRELDAEKKSRAMWQSMTSQLARDLNDEKARRARELSRMRAEYARGANGQWLVRVEELEAEGKRAGEEAVARAAADRAKLTEAHAELAAEKRQKQSWQQIAERIGKESKEGRREVEAIQKRLQEALKLAAQAKPPVGVSSPPLVPLTSRLAGRSAHSGRNSQGGSGRSQRESPAPEGGEPGEIESGTRGGRRDRGVAPEEEDEETDDDEEGEKRGAKVPPRKRLKSLSELGDEAPRKAWKSRRARGKNQGDQAEGGGQSELAFLGGGGEEE